MRHLERETKLYKEKTRKRNMVLSSVLFQCSLWVVAPKIMTISRSRCTAYSHTRDQNFKKTANETTEN